MRAARHNQKLRPYLSLPHKIWDLKDDADVLKLDWNEATIPPSPRVSAAVSAAVKGGRLEWYPNTKNKNLLKALAAYAQQESADFVELFAGSDAAHEGIIDTFLERDEVIGIISPTYDHFRARAQGVGLKTLSFELDANFELDFEALNVFLKEKKIKLLYLCNPNNPTGKAYSPQSLEDLVRDHPGVIFLIDEAYFEFYGQSLAHLCATCPNLIITRTFSKAFALASFRIGYVISHPENIAALNKLRNPKSVPLLSQVAAQAALEDLAYTRAYVSEVSAARAEFVRLLASMRGGGG